MKQEYVLCINNSGYEASLEKLKIYRAMPPESGDVGRGMTRVVDESGEDYLFPRKYFVSLALREPVLRFVERQFGSRVTQHKVAA